GVVHNLRAEGLVADVAGEPDRFGALRVHETDGFLGVLVLLQIDDGDPRPFPRHGDGNGPADPAVATGDERNLVPELADTRELGPVVRPWVHFALAAGLVFLLLGRHDRR